MDIKQFQKNLNDNYKAYLTRIVYFVLEEYDKETTIIDIVKKLEILNYDSGYYERTIPQDIRYEIIKRQKWKCNICNCPLKFNKYSKWEGEVAHIDHIHPYSKAHKYPKGPGFISEPSNLQALCPKCNLSKGKKEVN